MTNNLVSKANEIEFQGGGTLTLTVFLHSAQRPGCKGGSRCVDGCWGFPYLKIKKGFWASWFLVFDCLVFGVRCCVFWILGFEDSWFLGFKVSKIQRSHITKFVMCHAAVRAKTKIAYQTEPNMGKNPPKYHKQTTILFIKIIVLDNG